MDPIELLELCRRGANEGVPSDLFVPNMFSFGEFETLWRNDAKKVRRLLDETLCGSHPKDGLKLLMKTGVLHALFPEIVAMKDLGDGDGLHKDVWLHSINVVAGVPANVDIRWAALLHDIGKIRTRRVVRGRVTFHNHDRVGARMVDDMNARTRLFHDDVALLRTVRYLVLEHLRPAGYNHDWTDSAVRRLVTECGDVRFFEKLMLLSRADLTTKNPKKRERCMARAAELEKRVAKVIADARAPRLPKGTMGSIMEKVTDRKPGHWLNQVRTELESMMLSGSLLSDQSVDYYVNAGLRIVGTSTTGG